MVMVTGTIRAAKTAARTATDPIPIGNETKTLLVHRLDQRKPGAPPTSRLFLRNDLSSACTRAPVLPFQACFHPGTGVSAVCTHRRDAIKEPPLFGSPSSIRQGVATPDKVSRLGLRR